MPSTYTNLGIEKLVLVNSRVSEGTTTNTNFDILDSAITGVVSITLTGRCNSFSCQMEPLLMQVTLF